MRTRIVVAMMVAVFAFAACKGDKGDQGPAGAPGTSTPAPVTPGAGLDYQIQSATLASGAAPTVTFQVTDASGSPVALLNADGTLAFTPNFTIATRGADGNWSSLLTRTVTGKPWMDAAGTTHQPVMASATQAASEAAAAARISGGSGVYTYTFANPAASVDPTATFRVGMWGNRTFEGTAYPASSTLDFVPGGGTPTGTDLVSDAQCGVCHGVARGHGDQRLGVKLCMTCHTQQTVDPETGNSVFLPNLIHKIHMGDKLANGFTIVGFAPGNPAVLPASAVNLFGDVSMAPSESTYFELSKPGTPPFGTLPIDPREDTIVRNCAICHGAQASTVNAVPALSRATCVQCHDDVNFATGANHPRPEGGIIVTSDTACAGCHGPGGVDPAVRHAEDYETTRKLQFTPACTATVTTNCHKLEVAITDVKNAVAGQSPQIEFTVKLDGQPYDISTQPLAALGFQMAGPDNDFGYTNHVPTTQAVAADPTATPPVVANIAVSPGVSSALVSNSANIQNIAKMGSGPGFVEAIDAAGGKFRFTMPATAAIPPGSTGTYAFSYEAMYKESKTGPNGEVVSKPYAANPVFHGASMNVQYRDVTTGVAGAERLAIASTVDKCNNCHEALGFHSNRSRKGIDYCATCHGPNLDNRGRIRFQGPVGTTLLVESVSANVFIHRIHSGADLPSVQAGGVYQLGTVRTNGDAGPAAWAADSGGEDAFSDFSDFVAPRPVGACDTCHLPNTNVLPTGTDLPPLRRALLRCDEVVPAGGTDAGWCSTRSVAQETFTPPMKAVCTSCHDSQAAISHADLNTVYPSGSGGPASYNPYVSGTSGALDPNKVAVETCTTCHGPGTQFDPLVVHQAPTFLSGSR